MDTFPTTPGVLRGHRADLRRMRYGVCSAFGVRAASCEARRSRPLRGRSNPLASDWQASCEIKRSLAIDPTDKTRKDNRRRE